MYYKEDNKYNKIFFDEILKEAHEKLRKQCTFRVRIEPCNHPDVLCHINPHKQGELEVVLNILDVYKEYLKPCKIIVFGSSTNGFCVDESDIDFCLDSNNCSIIAKIRQLLTKVLTSDFDVIVRQDLEPTEPILKEINTNGVVIWDNK